MSSLVITLLVIALVVVIYKSEKEAILDCGSIIVEFVKRACATFKSDVALTWYEITEAVKGFASPLTTIGKWLSFPFIVVFLALLTVVCAVYAALSKLHKFTEISYMSQRLWCKSLFYLIKLEAMRIR